MPYSIKKKGKGHKVCKKGSNKCFSKKPMSKGKAARQMKAIYANESLFHKIVNHVLQENIPDTPAGSKSFNTPIQIGLSTGELASIYNLISKLTDALIDELSFSRLKAAASEAYATSHDTGDMTEEDKRKGLAYLWMPPQLEDYGISHIKFGMTITEIELFYFEVLDEIPHYGPNGREGTPLETLHGKLEEILQWNRDVD